MLITRLNSPSLRNSSFNLYVLTFFYKISNGIRSFAYAAPVLWNHIPATVLPAPT